MVGNKKDICVIGIGRFGFTIVDQLVDLRRQVLAIDKEEQKLIQVARIADTAILDGGDLDGLKELGIHEFDTVIVANGDNIEIIATLLELGVKHIIAKARSLRHERVLKQIGVDVIVRPEAEAGIRTALIATNPNFIKYSEDLQEIGDGYAIGTTLVTNLKWLNKPIKNLNFQKIGINIVSIKRFSKVIIPIGTTKIRSKDLVTIIGKITKITKALLEFNEQDPSKMIKLDKIEEALNKNTKFQQG